MKTSELNKICREYTAELVEALKTEGMAEDGQVCEKG